MRAKLAVLLFLLAWPATVLAAQAGKSVNITHDLPHVEVKHLGKPVVIESMGHLRQVEKQYGVVFSAFSQNPNNPDHTPTAALGQGSRAWSRRAGRRAGCG